MPTKTIAGILVALILLLVVFNYVTNMGPKPPPPKPITSADMWKAAVNIACKPARGNPNAKWTVIECGDFQCPICGTSRKYAEALIDESQGKAKLYFCNYPLDMHEFARPAALASLVAEKSGKFWPMYDQLYEHQANLNPKVILACAAAVGIDKQTFTKAVRSQPIQQRMEEQHAMGDHMGMSATPTFFVHQDGTTKYDTYIGMWPQKDFGNQPGLRQLVMNTPWGVKMPPADIPPPKSDKK